MNTDYLREFVVFAGHMSFTSAARTLSLSQPTLSRHISELERQYGCKLVDRSSQVLASDVIRHLESGHNRQTESAVNRQCAGIWFGV